MCQFFSAIVMRNGDLLWNPYTDSHEDLVALHNLRDNRDGNFARVEFTPKEPTDLDKPDKYLLKIDEARRPDWFSDEMEHKTTDSLRGIISRMIVSSPVSCLIGGAYILAKGAQIDFVKATRIAVMMGSSKVGEMWESSKVGVMWESSKVGVMWESSEVGVMLDSSKIGEMWESSKVGEMRQSSKVGQMRQSSKVGVMLDSSKVGVMLDSSKVGVMLDSSKVGVMWDSSKVVNDQRTKK